MPLPPSTSTHYHDLQHKINLVLHHNQQLIVQNQHLQQTNRVLNRTLNQLQLQAQLWRRKYQVQVGLNDELKGQIWRLLDGGVGSGMGRDGGLEESGRNKLDDVGGIANRYSSPPRRVVSHRGVNSNNINNNIQTNPILNSPNTTALFADPSSPNLQLEHMIKQNAQLSTKLKDIEAQLANKDKQILLLRQTYQRQQNNLSRQLTQNIEENKNKIAQLQTKLRDQYKSKQMQFEHILGDFELKAAQQQRVNQHALECLKRDSLQEKIRLIEHMEQQQKRKAKELRSELDKLYREDLDKLSQESSEKMRQERDKLDNYIRHLEEQVKTEGMLAVELEDKEQQVALLRDSLSTRQNVMDTLIQSLSGGSGSQGKQLGISWFEQVLSLRDRMAQLNRRYAAQTELLKLKFAQKHQLDIRTLQACYDSRLLGMAHHIRSLQSHSDRLRTALDTQLHTKITMKKNFEAQASKLKNTIRKLRVELHGIEEEFKLNIDGIKDHNLTFSQSMLHSMGQQKQKANFFEEQNRKLKLAYYRHQQQLIEYKKQADHKVAYYQHKYKDLKARQDEREGELKIRESFLDQQLELRSQMIRKDSQLEIDNLKDQIKELLSQLGNHQAKYNKLQDQMAQTDSNLREINQQLIHANSTLQQRSAQVQKLRMQLEMNNSQQQRISNDSLKNHYQRIIMELKGDKQLLALQVNSCQQQIRSVLERCKGLEQELARAIGFMGDRNGLEVELAGIERDYLVMKNLVEMFQ